MSTSVAGETRSNVGGGTGSVPRLAIFTSHPIQYQAPLFRALAEQGRVKPTVFFGSTTGLDGAFDPHYGSALKWDMPLLAGYENVFLENVAPEPDVQRFTGVRLADIESRFRDGEFDAVLVLGWTTRAHVQASRAALALGLPLFIRGESSLTMRPPSSARAFLRRALWVPARRIVYGSLFRRVTGFFVIGSRNVDFYRYHRVSVDKMWWTPYGVDNAHFALPTETRAAARARVRAELGVDESTTVFVSAAKLLPRKRPLDLLRAFARVEGDAFLLYLGGGPEREAVEAEAARLGVAGRMRISGFVNQSAIPDWYAASDCLVLPSDHMETWGLVVNEAMAAGLPAIVSDAVGCGPDLVIDDVTGFRFPLGDVTALAARMRAMVDGGSVLRRRMGEAARARVADFSVARSAEAIADGVVSATAPPDRRDAVRAMTARSSFAARQRAREVGR